ncbi:hypothetical protein BB559_006349 [Furculomyces boomerangus]|uniref:Uncharacterized protein n=1 Tax=Furculomyces boomerangus TaxID=61424 RepID=A0A2T9Y3F9_9FUNG|nr:hypothetical protein BB559_006349 [Furculomyces boomerangus]
MSFSSRTIQSKTNSSRRRIEWMIVENEQYTKFKNFWRTKITKFLKNYTSVLNYYYNKYPLECPGDLKADTYYSGEIKTKEFNVDLKKIYYTVNNYNQKNKSYKAVSLEMFSDCCEKLKGNSKESISAYVADYSNDIQNVRAITTSRESINRLSLSKVLHIDSTFKLVKGNYPVIISGITDNNQAFISVNIR